MKRLKVLIACEESQSTCIAFRRLGHFAFSCDIQPCSGGHPEWHLQCDCLPLIHDKWDLIIAHPPCTYMSKVGAPSMFPHPGVMNIERFRKALEAKDFFMKFYNCNCQHVAIENPIPLKCVGLPSCDQIIQPFEYGHSFSKCTLLWLKNLPFLIPTGIVKTHVCYTSTCSGSKSRSKSFSGISAAMAQQWSDYLLTL